MSCVCSSNQKDEAQRLDHSRELKAKNAEDVQSLSTALAHAKPEEFIKLITISECMIQYEEGDIALAQCDAVVNAANETLEGGGGVDYRIHMVAGPKLLEECKSIPFSLVEEDGGAIEKGEWTRCPVGQCRVTAAHSLPHAKYILHTVAPLLDSEGQPVIDRMRKCYRNCLEAANQQPSCHSIAFCSLGTGFYGFPQVLAARIAIETAIDFVQQTSNTQLQRVLFVTYGSQTTEIYKLLFKQYSEQL